MVGHSRENAQEKAPYQKESGSHPVNALSCRTSLHSIYCRCVSVPSLRWTGRGGGIDNQRHIFGNTEKPCVGNDQRDMSAIAVKGQEMRWRGMGFSFSFIPLVKCGSDEKPAEIRVFQ